MIHEQESEENLQGNKSIFPQNIHIWIDWIPSEY